ncbi:MAG: xanthine dehydrogenase family protein subunit M [Bacillota bacterium]
MLLPEFEYFAPGTVEEVLALLERFGDGAKILAGGTDLLLMMKDKVIRPRCLIDITGVAALNGIRYTPGQGLIIGAAAKIAVVERSPVVREKYFALHQAAGELGSAQVRAMATIGGNSCHASPAAETPPPLIALGAKVKLQSRAGERELPLADFILGNRQTALRNGEILTGFFLPEPPPNSASRYQCLGLRDAMEIDIVNAAVNLVLDEDGATCRDVRIVMGSVAPAPLRARQAESTLAGRRLDAAAIEEAARIAAGEAKPISDLRASAEYRREVTAVVVKRALQQAFYALTAGPNKGGLCS